MFAKNIVFCLKMVSDITDDYQLSAIDIFLSIRLIRQIAI